MRMRGTLRALLGFAVRVLPRDRPAWIATVVFLVAAVPLAWLARDERSGIIHMTRPTHGYTSRNLSTGYTVTLGERPFFRENVSFVEQLELFDGIRPRRTDFYYKRPLFAFLAAQVAPFAGVLPALVLVNFAGWALCAFAAWRFTLGVFQDRVAAALAVVFVAGGMGMVAHVGDYSAHLLSFCLYYLGALVLFESGVWRSARPLRTHLTLGLVLAVAFLSYNSGLMLLGVYLGVAVFRNRPWHVLVAAVIGVSGQVIWHLLLSASGLGFVDAERRYLDLGLRNWKAIFDAPWLEALRRTLGLVGEFSTFESPGVIVAGAAGLCLLLGRRPLLWFFLVLAAVPVASSLVFATAAGARGYLVWQISLVFFCAASRFFALGLRRAPPARLATAAGLAAVLAVHFACSTSHVRGDPGPVKTYHFGLDEGWPLLKHGPPRALSLTGAEPTPVLFGGDATLVEAGLRAGEAVVPVLSGSVSWKRSAVMRLLFYGYLGAACWMLMRPGRARTVVAGLWLLAAATLPAAAVSLTDERLDFVDQAFHVPPSTRVECRVQLSDEFVSALSSTWTEGLRLAFQVRWSERAGFVVRAGDEAIAARWVVEEGMPAALTRTYLCYAERPAAAVEAIARAHEVTFEFTARERESLGAWQRRGLPGRTLSAWNLAGDPVALETDYLPGAEIRLIRPDRTVALVGF
jgi:hypothetical protein